MCLLVHHSYLTETWEIEYWQETLRQVTFSRSLSKFIFTSKGRIAAYEGCAGETFSFHQSLSLCSEPQHELRHGHQLSSTVCARFAFSLTQTVSFSLTKSKVQARLEQYHKAPEGNEDKWSIQA